MAQAGIMPLHGNLPPIVTVNLVIFSLCENQLQVLLTPSEPDTRYETWTLPGSCWESGLTFEEISLKILSRHTQLHEAYLEQLYTYGSPDRDPQQSLVSVVYFVLVPAQDLNTKQCLLVRNAKWFPVDHSPSLIKNHLEIITYALRRLRYKLEYTAIGFELLPSEFTLSARQHTYEMVLGECLDKRNFRRRILEAEIIEATPNMRAGEGRPARLYRYRPDAVAEVKARRLFP